jgi:ABC-type transport system involved in multi-copper enzyme maturation permease subunit
MSSKAITKDKQDERNRQGGWQPPPESAPSVLREDEPGLPRTLGMAGAALVIFGGMALAFNLSGRLVRVNVTWSAVFLALGLCGLLFHAAFDRDVQFRRMYMAFAYALLIIGTFLCIFPYPTKVWGGQFRYGFLCLLLSLFFMLAYLRNETDRFVRNVAELTVGGAGAVMVLIGLVGGNVRGEFLLPYGLLLSILGVVYLTAFVGVRGTSSDLAYNAGRAIAALGLLVMLIALVRTFLPATPRGYFLSYGLVLLVIGLIYAVVGFCLFSDSSLVVLTRREIGAFFYSPIAYLTVLGFTVAAWVSFSNFIDGLTERGGPLPVEPVVRNYIFALFPVIVLIFAVPVLTMRLLSEEQRSGTLEVLLTAPVDESVVVLSKFFGAFVAYLTAWLPFGLFLLAIPLAGGNAFDYRPLFSFALALVVSGAGFIGMGLFFSSLTKSQVASGVLTFAGMAALTAVYFTAYQAKQNNPGGAWDVVLSHMSYLDLWFRSLEGKVIPRDLLFFPSLAVMCLFLTVKVLESRKWR